MLNLQFSGPMSLGAPSAQGGGQSAPPRPDYPPFVVLVDIDGTIIGEIDAQLVEYQLIVKPPAAKKKSLPSTSTFREKMYKDQLVTQLMNGLMRPGFSAFCAQCAIMGIPIMLYTAAEDEWAHFLVPAILQAVRIEMQRDLENPPKNFKFVKLFTRKNCTFDQKNVPSTKSLQRIAKDMHATLKKDYAMSRGIEGLLDRTILIDNTPGVLAEANHLVIVPTYNFAYLYDVMMNIDHTDGHHMAQAKSLLLGEDSFLDGRVRMSYNKSISQLQPPPSFRTWFYRALSKQMQETSLAYEHAKHHDNLWKTLRRRVVTYFREGHPLSGPQIARFMSTPQQANNRAISSHRSPPPSSSPSPSPSPCSSSKCRPNSPTFF